MASLLAATVAVFVFGPGAVGRLRPDDAVLLAGAAAVIAVLAMLRAPNAPFEQSPRPTADSDRAGLVVPVLLVVLVHFGSFWAALVNVLTELVRPSRARRRPVFQRILTASLRAPGWAAGIVIERPLRALVALPASPPAMGTFVLIAAVFVLAVDLLWIDPLFALRQQRSLLRIWARHLTDLTTLTTIVAEALWAYLAARIAVGEGPFLAVVAL
ncbi:MAG TPA: hypothetical protein VE591_12825, partial [Candidatus Acidoferrum sp.]|nr:hypothetical protein [Candidatus Acidoferrum sp.]